MTDNTKLEKVINGLKCYTSFMQGEHNICKMEYCPYWNESGKWTLCNNFQMQLDALALLEELEPRVLLPEEAKALKRETVIYIERRDFIRPYPRIVLHADNNYVIFTNAEQYFFEEDGYSERYRFWTSEPSDEQRKITPWIGERKWSRMADICKVIKGLQDSIDDIMDTPSYPYFEESRIDTGLMREVPVVLLKDTIDILKTQKPRIVSFEEINNHEVLWVEMRGMNGEEGLAPWIKTRSGRWYSPLYCNGSEPGMLLSTAEEYGIFCRAWTSEPSDEQREETKWQSSQK